MATEAANQKLVPPTSGDTVVKNEGPRRQIQPNNLVFTDPSGTRHELYLPKGTYQKAIDLYKEGIGMNSRNFLYIVSERSVDRNPLISYLHGIIAGQGYEEWD